MTAAAFPLQEIRQQVLAGTVSCEERVRMFHKRIEEHAALNAFVELFAEQALSDARDIDKRIRAGLPVGRLAGCVLGIKDVICYRDHGLTASSRMLEGFTSRFTATALQRLLDEDAIIIGRQGCDEFAMGSTNESSVYGPARNPYNPDMVPGGSSGASAVAVAAGLCDASLGSDTGGSVRQPASFCGVTGLKPTYGRISRWGLIAYGSSFDQIGPITRSVEDAALLLEIMAGYDPRDNTSSGKPVPPYSQVLAEKTSKPQIIGYLQEALDHPGLDPEVKRNAEESLERMRDLGHEVKPLHFSMLDYLVPCYYILTTAEASSNLARYDGVHYGYRSAKSDNLSAIYTNSRREGFGKEVQKRILLGTFVLSAGYADAYYGQAMKVRRLIRDETLTLFSRCDALFCPTAPAPPYALGLSEKDPIAMYLGDIFTVLANLAGIPAISVPTGTNRDGLPIGMQLMGKPFSEPSLLAIAANFAFAGE